MADEHTIINTRQLAQFHTQLARWYRAHGRHALPWRNTADPYAIWVSEVMLQQTQVATVLDKYYGPFLQQFPTVQALAAAPQEAVLKAWQGLGYYSRAVNLHKAAMGLQASGFWLQHTSKPDAESLIPSLLALPGIGQNTAHAIAAFAFHLPVPVLEANVKRVVARILALSAPPSWAHAEALLDHKNPFDYNQAMMDLGAMLCTPRAPKCDGCPAARICQGKHAPEEFPGRKQKKTVPVRRMRIVVRMDSKGRVHAAPRTEKFLHGMYRFEEYPSPRRGRVREGAYPLHSSKSAPLLTSPLLGEELGTITHTYSHFKLEAEVYVARHPGVGRGGFWHTLAAFKKLPHSRVEEKVLELL